MKFKQWLEMSIVNFQKIGDWEPEKPTPPGQKPSAYDMRRSAKKGYYKDDFGILTSESGVEKIKKKWSKCEQPFNTFFLRSKEGAKVREVGEVKPNYLTEILKLKPNEVEAINNSSAINIVFTNNKGAERMPMNWWTMAHRVGHAISRPSGFSMGRSSYQVPEYDLFIKTLTQELYLLLDRVYDYKRSRTFQPDPKNEKILLSFMSSIGSMKSARDNNIRNIPEFYHELTAQYIVEGKIKFRHLPKMIVTNYMYGRPSGIHISRELDSEDIEMWNEYLDDHLSPEIDSYISRALDKCIGRIFVM